MKKNVPSIQEKELDGLERISGRLHQIFVYLPKYLKIKKSDVLLMHDEVDDKAEIFSLPYWLFVIISCGIATIGLIINSPAVIIGAMLISPLMGPILGLGMGIAISDLYLSIKSIINILLSISIVILTSAFITKIVPLQEITSEILARISPTVLDLFIALFAGLVAALSSVRINGEDLMGDVAPGAAIGVALMPPLCVTGYGLGIGFDTSIMWGSFLLFLTNLFGIVMISSLFYYAIYEGYNIEKLVEIINKKRQKIDEFYLKLNQLNFYIYLTDKIFSKKRFLFPLFLILLISYPLSTSLAYLKKKNDLKNAIESFIKESKNIELIRGTENLIFTKDSVNGTILYSSKGVVDPAWEKEIQEKLQKQFPDFKLNISFIRIAGESDIQQLQKLSQNIVKDEKTENAIRNKYAAEIVNKIFEYIINQYPKEAGIILKINTIFTLNGIETIELFVAGKTLSKDAESILKQSFIQGLKTINISPSEIKISYISSNPKALYCNKKNYKLTEVIQEIHNASIIYLIINPNLKIDIYLEEEIYEILKLNSTESFKERLHYYLLPTKENKNNCKAMIYYSLL
ncbi:MAG: hypothetical protein KatS3mg129_1805 [Leptospiraceae bacterium]|nr:MAG: hypothetical protein KatS3mg129_1805 [Leptospiraceae bacterium]